MKEATGSGGSWDRASACGSVSVSDPYKMSLLGQLPNHFIDTLNGDTTDRAQQLESWQSHTHNMAIKLFTLLAIGLALIALSQGESPG